MWPTPRAIPLWLRAPLQPEVTGKVALLLYFILGCWSHIYTRITQQVGWRCELSWSTRVGLHWPSSSSSKDQAQLLSLCWMNQWFLSQDCQEQTGAKECRCSADAGTLGAGLHPLSRLYSHCTAVRQSSYGHYRAGRRMEPDNHTQVSVFYNQLGAVCWDLLHRSIQRYSSVETN